MNEIERIQAQAELSIIEAELLTAEAKLELSIATACIAADVANGGQARIRQFIKDKDNKARLQAMFGGAPEESNVACLLRTKEALQKAEKRNYELEEYIQADECLRIEGIWAYRDMYNIDWVRALQINNIDSLSHYAKNQCVWRACEQHLRELRNNLHKLLL